jgi:hypothetical protein
MKNIRIICLFLLLIYSHVTVGHSQIQNIYPLILTILIISLILLFVLTKTNKIIELIILSVILLIYGLNIFYHILVIIIILYYILFLTLEICQSYDIKILFLYFFGCSIIVGLLYLRLRPRTPYELTFEFNIIKCIFLLFSISWSLFYIYSIWRKKTEYSLEKHKRLRILVEFLILVYQKIYRLIVMSVETIYYFFVKSKLFRIILLKIGIFLLNFKLKPDLLYFWCSIVFRSLVATAYFIDVCIYNRFEYFYLLVVILIVPFSFQYLLIIINMFGHNLKEEASKYIYAEIVKETRERNRIDTILGFNWQPNHNETKNGNIQFFIRNYMWGHEFQLLYENVMLQKKNIYFKYCNTGITVLFLISFSYIFFFSLVT